jgi:predicted O-methyltransferase YrrM
MPNTLQPIVKSIYIRATDLFEYQYEKMHPDKKTDQQLHSEFVSSLFDSRSEYQRYVNEFEKGPVAEIREEALHKYSKLTGENSSMGAISLDAARDYYAVTRKTDPDVVVETGVCNGLSTVSILLAIQKNGSGELYSIDYPYRADEPLENFRNKTFEDYGGAAIPSDKQPGWIIPEELRGQWTLHVGKSQRELPKLVSKLNSIDLFIHDSEHSHPCMMFEYELAYEWLKDGGMILSDDITWNEAFNIFTRTREPEYGKISKSTGYMIKNNG